MGLWKKLNYSKQLSMSETQNGKNGLNKRVIAVFLVF